MSANAYKRAVEEMEGNIARSIVSLLLLIELRGSADRRKRESRTHLIELLCWNLLVNSIVIYLK